MVKKLRLFLLVPGAIILAGSIFAAIGSNSTILGNQDETPRGNGKGLVSVVSAHSVDETVLSLQEKITAAGFAIPLTIDHGANADSIGKELRPTRLIIFGNPEVGTVLMQNRQTVAIDLPQKFLVWEDGNGTVRITYNDPRFVGKRHKIKVLNDNLDKISKALNNLAAAAAQ